MGVRQSLHQRQTVIGVDPGREKTGLAVVSGPPPYKILDKSVVKTEDLSKSVSRLVRSHDDVSMFIVGNGTGSVNVTTKLKEWFPAIPVNVVEEHGTSARARKRFIAEEPANFFQKLIPAGLRSPNKPYDDYVAVILAEDYLR